MWETKEHVLFMAGATLLLAVGAFILWGPVQQRRKKGQICGLTNLGYTCFLNTLLQALSSCPVVLDWLKRQHLNKSQSLTEALHSVLKALNEGTEDPYTPVAVIQSLLKQGWVISPGEQDAHELFHVIVTTLEEETQQPLSQVCSLSDALETEGPEVQGIILLDTLPLHRSRSREALPFQGLFANQLECVTCKHKSGVNYSSFYSVSLALPSRLQCFGRCLTVHELLENFIASRVVNAVTCDHCENKETDHVKTVSFGKLPSCLCIHIARTIWEVGEPMKRDDYVEFPEMLVMDPYTYTQLKQQMVSGDQAFRNGLLNMSSPTLTKYKHIYKLAAVVVHKGGVLSGHFVTYRRGVSSHLGSWWYTSDTEVRETTWLEVKQASAYMLFYIKFPSL